MDHPQLIQYIKQLESNQNQNFTTHKSELNNYYELSSKCRHMGDELKKRLPHSNKVIDTTLTTDEVDKIFKSPFIEVEPDINNSPNKTTIQMEDLDELETFFEKTKNNLQAIKRSANKKPPMSELSKFRSMGGGFGSMLDMTGVGKNMNFTMLQNNTTRMASPKEPVVAKFNSTVFKELQASLEQLEAALESRVYSDDLAMDAIMHVLQINEMKIMALFQGKHHELNKSINNATKVEFPEKADAIAKDLDNLLAKITALKEYANAYAVKKESNPIPFEGIMADLAAHARF